MTKALFEDCGHYVIEKTTIVREARREVCSCREKRPHEPHTWQSVGGGSNHGTDTWYCRGVS